MADVTNAPVPTGGSPFDVPSDLAELAGHFGDLDYFSRATASALPSSGNWQGRILMARDTGILYRCISLPGTWRAITDVAGTISPASGFSLQSASFLKRDSEKNVSGLLMVSRAAALSHNLQVATLPTGFRPPIDLTVRDTSYVPSGLTGPTDYVISTNGAVTAYSPPGTTTHTHLRLLFRAA